MNGARTAAHRRADGRVAARAFGHPPEHHGGGDELGRAARRRAHRAALAARRRGPRDPRLGLRRAARALTRTRRHRERAAGPAARSAAGADPPAWEAEGLDTALASGRRRPAERDSYPDTPIWPHRRASPPDAGGPLVAGGGGGGGGGARGRAGAGAATAGGVAGASERDLDDVRGLSPEVICQILRKAQDGIAGWAIVDRNTLLIARASRGFDELHRTVTCALHVSRLGAPEEAERLQRKIGRSAFSFRYLSRAAASSPHLAALAEADVEGGSPPAVRMSSGWGRCKVGDSPPVDDDGHALSWSAQLRSLTTSSGRRRARGRGRRRARGPPPSGGPRPAARGRRAAGAVRGGRASHSDAPARLLLTVASDATARVAMQRELEHEALLAVSADGWARLVPPRARGHGARQSVLRASFREPSDGDALSDDDDDGSASRPGPAILHTSEAWDLLFGGATAGRDFLELVPDAAPDDDALPGGGPARAAARDAARARARRAADCLAHVQRLARAHRDRAHRAARRGRGADELAARPARPLRRRARRSAASPAARPSSRAAERRNGGAGEPALRRRAALGERLPRAAATAAARRASRRRSAGRRARAPTSAAGGGAVPVSVPVDASAVGGGAAVPVDMSAAYLNGSDEIVIVLHEVTAVVERERLVAAETKRVHALAEAARTKRVLSYLSHECRNFFFPARLALSNLSQLIFSDERGPAAARGTVLAPTPVSAPAPPSRRPRPAAVAVAVGRRSPVAGDHATAVWQNSRRSRRCTATPRSSTRCSRSTR